MPPVQSSTYSDLSSDECPVCHSTKYLNPTLKLLVSPCFHKMCETCIGRLFTAGAAPCPICGQNLRKSNFVAQTFEDLYVEREVGIRRKMGRCFNKRLEDFNGDLKNYNNYLEEVEEIMFNLINDVDVQQTNERIERYRQENKEEISANLAKQAQEEKMLSHKLDKEKREKIHRKEVYLQHAMEETRAREVEKEDIIRQLAEATDKSASDVIREHKMTKKTTVALNIPTLEDSDDEDMTYYGRGDLMLREDDHHFDAADMAYEPVAITLDSYIDPWTQELQKNPQARAGGYMAQCTQMRSMFQAFHGVLDGISIP
ncbi:CDK-activating kinase assembly factor MAT1-domain-containing protein [Polychytrium aggregatum]|uniref:CDK-activating kinase assembly factor MAT1-domain-containing protein n=1 Tax=Polychytrium aggregatum TaxID=110093 RepID=UPI0022FE6002|nr:CDK-activating kinase assembly factor MAT1-domain-containing protein [Polychytrium aggregatum]KAI9209744.1 CDK-activating kinase assembly factor MAT1-domain-containing protein [Polychytrium aggregatum]